MAHSQDYSPYCAATIACRCRVLRGRARTLEPDLNTQPKLDLPPGCAVSGTLRPGFETILTREAMDFVVELARKFGPRVEELLARREVRQKEIDAGALPDFLAETRAIRESEWHVTSIPADLQDRRVEITGPTDRKMIINALNSGAKVFMADCEDSMTPTWDNVVQGQINLRDAAARRIEFASPDGKQYRLNPTIATLIVRPRGWHLYEKHILVDGKQVPGAFVDFGLYLFHNHAELKRQRHRPVFLPAEDREPPRGAPLGGRVPARRSAPRPRAADDQGDAADRGDPRGLRDGRDPLGAARLHRRAQLRPLGLHLQLHQEVQPLPGQGAAGPRAGHDDDALPALVLEAADQDHASSRRVRDGRHGRADPDQGRPGRQ